MKKIMFNDKYGLTQAVLEGRKTHTRRVVTASTIRVAERDTKILGGDIKDRMLEHSPYLFGEVIAVAQSYKDIFDESGTLFHESFSASKTAGYTNKMFVKASLMSHRIKIANVRVERLQDISAEDCLKEGIKRKNERYCVENYKGVCFYTNDPILAFRCLIDKTCGKGTWDSNPWVFVYDFELIK